MLSTVCQALSGDLLSVVGVGALTALVVVGLVTAVDGALAGGSGERVAVVAGAGVAKLGLRTVAMGVCLARRMRACHSAQLVTVSAVFHIHQWSHSSSVHWS